MLPTPSDSLGIFDALDTLTVSLQDSCQSSASSYFGNSKIPWHAGSDKKGYITLWPSSPNSGTCWDVSSKSSLTHGGGGDSQAIANMVDYAITKYGVNRDRVYLTGGSSGAMMGNVLAATYPALFKAASLYSGVPAGCFVSSSGGVDQWNNTCSGGQSKASAEQWYVSSLCFPTSFQ